MEKNGGPGFRLGPKTARIVFEGTPYDGAEVVIRIRIPLGDALQFQDFAGMDIEDKERMFDVFAQIALVEWNLQEHDGTPIPCDADGLRAIDTDLATIILNQWSEALGQTPDPLGQTSIDGSTSEEVTPKTERESPNLESSSERASSMASVNAGDAPLR